MRLRRLDSRLGDRIDELRRSAEMGCPLRFGVVKKDATFLREGRAVIEEQRRTRCQAGREPVPHHPAEGGEIEQTISRLDVAMQLWLAQVLEQRATRPVHDALRHTRGPRGKQYVEGMVEGQLLAEDVAPCPSRDEISEALRSGD